MTASRDAQANAERWTAGLSGFRTPMTEASCEKMLADWRAWYAEGRCTFAALESGVERVLRAFY